MVTITALFNKSMTATPTLSISGGLLSNVAFTSYTTENSQIGGDIDGEATGNGLVPLYQQVVMEEELLPEHTIIQMEEVWRDMYAFMITMDPLGSR